MLKFKTYTHTHVQSVIIGVLFYPKYPLQNSRHGLYADVCYIVGNMVFNKFTYSYHTLTIFWCVYSTVIQFLTEKK